MPVSTWHVITYPGSVSAEEVFPIQYQFPATDVANYTESSESCHRQGPNVVCRSDGPVRPRLLDCNLGPESVREIDERLYTFRRKEGVSRIDFCFGTNVQIFRVTIHYFCFGNYLQALQFFFKTEQFLGGHWYINCSGTGQGHKDFILRGLPSSSPYQNVSIASGLVSSMDNPVFYWSEVQFFDSLSEGKLMYSILLSHITL